MLANQDITFIDALMISITGILMVFLELALLALIVTFISKAISAIEKKRNSGKVQEITTVTEAVPVQAGTPLPETESAGSLDLVNVSEKDAALIMAIISNQSGIPLNKLSFKSIKLVEEKD